MNRKAFTLIELLVVVAVLALLASIVFSNLGGAREGARISNLISFHSQTHSLLGSDLVGWWKFDEGASDSSGYGNHGIVSGATLVDGAIGRAYDFSSGNTISVSDNFDALNLKTYTYVFWVKLKTDYTGSWRRFLGRSGGGTDRSPGFWFYHTSNRIHLQQRLINGTNGGGVDTSNLTLDQWHHIVFSSNWNGNNTILRSWKDGEEFKQNSYSSEPTSVTAPLLFQASGVSYDIDDVRIYSRALSASEVSTLYAQTKDKYLANE